MIKIDLTDKAEYFCLREEYYKRISKYIRINIKTTIKLKDSFPKLYQFLFDETTGELKQDNLRHLLIGPDKLPQSLGGAGEEKSMRRYLKSITREYMLPDGAERKKQAKECCRQIFDYKRFIREQKDAYWLLRTLNVRVCPYCNRVYTVTLPSPEELDEDEKYQASRATFDHYYCQAEYPHLALSLFNLVPSCFSCNMNKKNLAEELVYPYEEEFGEEAVFRVIPDLKGVTAEDSYDILNFLHGESDRFLIRFMTKDGIALQKDALLENRLAGIENERLRKSICSSVITFKLEELYKEHAMEIRDILRNRYYFDKQYVKTVICPMLQQKMKLSEDETQEEEELEKMAMDMLFFTRMDGSEWGKRPLSKLVADIVQQVTV